METVAQARRRAAAARLYEVAVAGMMGLRPLGAWPRLRHRLGAPPRRRAAVRRPGWWAQTPWIRFTRATASVLRTSSLRRIKRQAAADDGGCSGVSALGGRTVELCPSPTTPHYSGHYTYATLRHLGRAHSGGLGPDLALTAAGSGANTATAPPPLPSAGLADLRSPDPQEEAESSSPAAPTTASSTHRSIHEIVLCFAFTFACFYRFPSWSVCTWLLQRRAGMLRRRHSACENPK
ncbi:hypothetical protein ACP70R_018804 [Stipagrostis hirtigluma subsp. patula]